MGTNYYLVKKLSRKDKDLLKNEIIDLSKKIDIFSNYNDVALISETAQNIEIQHKIHLCKMSAGWKIFWDHNNLQFWNEMSLDSLKKWIEDHKDEYDLIDEYYDYVDKARIYSLDDFWKKVEEMSQNKSLLDNESYYKKENGISNKYLEEIAKPVKIMFNDKEYTFQWRQFINQEDGSVWEINTNFC